jgi:hypothetical protein
LARTGSEVKYPEPFHEISSPLLIHLKDEEFGKRFLKNYNVKQGGVEP